MVASVRREAGQTATEYLGVLLIVAAIVGTVLKADVAKAISGGLETQICKIVHLGGGASCGAKPQKPAGTPVVASGPAIGRIPYIRPGVAWDGSLSATYEVEGGGSKKLPKGKGAASGGAYAEVTVSRSRTPCRLGDDGGSTVSLDVRGELKVGVRGEVQTPYGTVGGDSYKGSSIGWTVQTDKATADQITSGGDLPTPADPLSMPQGTSITLDESFFKGQQYSAGYKYLKATYGSESGKKFSSTVSRVGPSTVRVTVGDEKYVKSILAAELGTDDVAIGLASEEYEGGGKASQVDIDLSTPAGRRAYAAFVGKGRLPAEGDSVTNLRNSETYNYSDTGSITAKLGPFGGTYTTSDENVNAVRTKNPDGTTSISTYGQDKDVSLVGTATESAGTYPNVTYSDLNYTMRLQGLPSSDVKALQRTAGGDGSIDGSKDATIKWDHTSLQNMRTQALDQLVYATERDGEDLGDTQEQKRNTILQRIKSGEGGVDYSSNEDAYRIASLPNKSKIDSDIEIMNYINQQMGRGGARQFVYRLQRFHTQTQDARGHDLSSDDPDDRPLPGPQFSKPAC